MQRSSTLLGFYCTDVWSPCMAAGKPGTGWSKPAQSTCCQPSAKKPTTKK